MIQPHDRLCPSSAHDQHVRSEWFPFYIALSDLVRLYQVIIMAICLVSRERAEVTEEHSWVPACQPICQPLSIRLTHPHISSRLSTCLRSKFNMKCNVCTEDELRMLCAGASLATVSTHCNPAGRRCMHQGNCPLSAIAWHAVKRALKNRASSCVRICYKPSRALSRNRSTWHSEKLL